RFLIRRCPSGLAYPEFAGLRRFFRPLLLDRITDGGPPALTAGHRTPHGHEAALDIGLHDLEIERGHALDTEMARHFLVLERLAWVLTAAGATNRTVRNRHTVRRT